MKKILVVDDSPSVRQQVGVALSQGGYSIIEATDGQDGLAKFGSGGISMIISDVNMPRMNGLEMLEKLKAGGAAVPVIMLTSEGQPALIGRAREAGAAAWIIKPFKPNLLMAAVKKMLGE
jgi:two-component system chemotaxis response regulator CheY